MIIACPHCFAKNRIDSERLQENPQCGSCHQTLLSKKPVELADDTFGRIIAATELPVVVDFWASWCGPCKMMAPHFEHAASQLPTVQFAKLNTEIAQQVAGQFGIRSIPTLILFKQGKEVARQAGAMTSTQIQQWIHATQ